MIIGKNRNTFAQSCALWCFWCVLYGHTTTTTTTARDYSISLIIKKVVHRVNKREWSNKEESNFYFFLKQYKTGRSSTPQYASIYAIKQIFHLCLCDCELFIKTLLSFVYVFFLSHIYNFNAFNIQNTHCRSIEWRDNVLRDCNLQVADIRIVCVCVCVWGKELSYFVHKLNPGNGERGVKRGFTV